MNGEATRPRTVPDEPRLADRRVLVIGLGKSGLAAIKTARSRGARVLAADLRTEGELGPLAARARSLGAELHAGGHPAELAAGRDLVVVSPGVPLDVAVLAAARRLEIPIWGELELASRFCQGRIVAVTGSNGKSSVTSMAGTILRAAGVPGGTGGNLDTPLGDLLELDRPEAVHAVEVSSFQLETVERFRPHVALILNLSPDHLDRHPSFEAYARAKARLLELQDRQDFALLNADDAESARFEPAVRGRLHRFSTRREVDPGAFLRDGTLMLRTDAGEETLLDASELPVPGEHNRANALAAALACRLAGCAPQAIAAGLRAYRALPHRLEYVGSIDDIAFYNDSKATNLDATARALTSFPPRTVQLILGGKDKGTDWSALGPMVRRHAQRVLLVGQAAEAIRIVLAGTVPLVDCDTIPRAVQAGYEAGRPGEVVLLSPACASFDQYRNFEERGDDFRRAVESLIAEGKGHA